MSSIQPAQHKSPLVPSLFKTIRSGYSLGMLSKDVSAGITWAWWRFRSRLRSPSLPA